MIHYYLQIKSAHVFLGITVALVFVATFIAASLPALSAARTPIKYVSWTADIALLTAAMMLLTILPGEMYANGWLIAKLLALAGFVVCRHFMGKEHALTVPRWTWFLVGLLLLAYAYTVAREHHPLGYLSQLGL
ncbi:SirB2 family protein [Pseudoxanthomonas sp. LjRoot143]|uniref:SirB2 family protein n=1 Tax=Pseudoxanthomonas sp. LjRoot143 TaxID=3342266 RepID=UPI003ECD2717